MFKLERRRRPREQMLEDPVHVVSAYVEEVEVPARRPCEHALLREGCELVQCEPLKARCVCAWMRWLLRRHGVLSVGRLESFGGRLHLLESRPFVLAVALDALAAPSSKRVAH